MASHADFEMEESSLLLFVHCFSFFTQPTGAWLLVFTIIAISLKTVQLDWSKD